jgi:heme-degrading monooxygenase HmoA
MEQIGEFVAINRIDCEPGYQERFETLFKSRAHAIDMLPGFKRMFVLKSDENHYLVVSFWTDKESFMHWMKTEEFVIGHQRGFADVAEAKRQGRPSPMTSNFKTYTILTN